MHDHDPARPRDWREAFSALPLESPPPGGWDALSSRLDARNPDRMTPRVRGRTHWPRWAAGAAAAAVALAIVLPWPTVPDTAPAPPPGTAASAAASADDPLEPLYAESARLEYLLAISRDERVSSATAAVLSETLEERLASIDAALAQPGLDQESQLALWQQRVDSLRALTGFESNRRWLVAQGTRYDAALVLVD